ncbi:MAG: hypothetical protein ACERKZ_15800 [Lachnotalea sp.]
MKKFLFGTFITVIGLIFSAFCFIYTAINPCDYDGITGLRGAFLGTGLLFPFIISLTILIVGLSICWYEAYRRK